MHDLWWATYLMWWAIEPIGSPWTLKYLHNEGMMRESVMSNRANRISMDSEIHSASHWPVSVPAKRSHDERMPYLWYPTYLAYGIFNEIVSTDFDHMDSEIHSASHWPVSVPAQGRHDERMLQFVVQFHPPGCQSAVTGKNFEIEEQEREKERKERKPKEMMKQEFYVELFRRIAYYCRGALCCWIFGHGETRHSRKKRTVSLQTRTRFFTCLHLYVEQHCCATMNEFF